jgi:hypothetical protein
MILTEISNNRLRNQQINSKNFKSIKELVEWMGAMQAQDYSMAKLAVGSRVLNSTDQIVESFIDKGEIIRTHILRPTWHFVSADDIFWMLQLTAPHIKSAVISWNKAIGLSESTVKRSNRILEQVLSKEMCMTREEIVIELNKANIKTEKNRLSHILICAELDGIVCSGKIKGGKQTYALLHDRVSKRDVLSRDEALFRLSTRYIKSHGPATVKDFIWWSGLPSKDARSAFESVRKDFITESIGSETYWFEDSSSINIVKSRSVLLLPAYDEFLIAYCNRNASLSNIDNRKAISNNGIFRPVIVINGQVVGIWKRMINKDKVMIALSLFQPVNNKTIQKIKETANGIGKFLNKQAAIELIAN